MYISHIGAWLGTIGRCMYISHIGAWLGTIGLGAIGPRLGPIGPRILARILYLPFLSVNEHSEFKIE